MGSTLKLDTHYHNIFRNAADTANLAAEDTDVTDHDLGDKFIVCIQVTVGDPCNKASDSAAVKLQYSKDSGAWTDVATGNELVPAADVDVGITDGASVSATARCGSTPTGCAQSHTTDGYESCGADCTTPAFSLATEYWTECHFGVDPSGATAGSEYEFRLTNITDSIDLTPTCPASITMATPSGAEYDETIVENLAMQDSIKSPGNVFGFTLVESLASGDALGPATVDHNVTIEEVASMLDVLTVTADHNVAFEDAVALTDAIKQQWEHGLTLEEALAVVDAIATSADLNIKITEQLSLTDSVKTIVAMWVSISEILALTDIIDIPLPGVGETWDETIIENLAMQDALTTSLISYLELEDNASLLDVITTTATMYVAIKEALALADTVGFEDVGEVINWTLTENMAVQDQIASIITVALALSEDLALQDVIGDTVVFNIKLTENVSLNEVMSTILEYGLKITENLAMGEVFVLTRLRPSLVIRRGKTFVFTIDQVSPHIGVGTKKGKPDVKKWH
jgi:hypothetical protein